MAPSTFSTGAMSGRRPIVVRRPDAAEGIGRALRSTFSQGQRPSIPIDMQQLLQRLD